MARPREPHRETQARGRLAVGICALALGAVAALTSCGGEPSAERASIETIAEQRDANRGGRLSDRVISRESAPPEGTRSLFDHLLAENGGLPYPFEKLVALVESYNTGDDAPVQILIPDGRSLLKGQANFHRPRILYAPDFEAANTPANLGIAARGQLFLGFVENAAEIEVISYNEGAGRYEFQLVTDYRADGARKLIYANRAVCTSCHQGAAPIFPVRPWDETNARPAIAQRIAHARESEAAYHKVPLRQPLAVPERFDELTDRANFVPVAQQLWLDACDDGVCRREMLRAALAYLWNPGDFAESHGDALRAAQRDAWPEDGIAVPDSDLTNRDPLAHAKGWRGILEQLFPPEPPPPGPASNEDLAAFDRLPPLPAPVDPLTQRGVKRVIEPGALDGAYGLAQLFTTADVQDLEEASGYQWQAVDAAVDALDPALFGEAPFSRVAAMQQLLTALDAGRPGFCCLDTAELSPPIVGSEPPLELAEDSPLQPFADYCFACHRGNPRADLNFMAGDTADEVLARIKDTPEIRDVLDWERYRGTDKAGTLMPPADAPERAELEAALKQGAPELKRMRDVVPSMFDF